MTTCLVLLPLERIERHLHSGKRTSVLPLVFFCPYAAWMGVEREW